MPAKFRLTEIVSKTKRSDNPVILDFQNGELEENADVSYFKAKNSKQSNREMAVVATKSNVYHGNINESFASGLINNYLAIKNKKTGKVRLVQVDQASLLNDIYFQQDAYLAQEWTVDSARDLLIQNFGGRQANRALERRERMKVDIDIVKGQLDKTLEKSVIDEADDDFQPMDEANINKIRPPFNAEASRIDDIYQLSHIIPNELLDKLNGEAKAVVGTNVDELPISSDYLKGRIKSIQACAVPDSTKNLTLVKVFVYMDALQKLLKGKEKDMKKATLSDITERVENDIRRRFSDPNMATMKKTRFTREKATCYYIALAVLTSPDYQLDMNTLSADLGINRQTVLKYSQLVYAKPITRTDILTFKLPSTVKLGSLFMGKRKRK